MVTPPDIEAQILRFYHAEKWTVGTIARQLHIHHGVVRRVLAQAGLPRPGASPRPSKIDAYLPFIRQTLERFPTLTASRLYVMAYERGYRGSPDHFRHLIACHRPRLPQRSPERTRLRSPELTQRVRMGLCSGGRISRYLAYMKVSIPPSRPGFRKTLRQPAVESLPCPRLGPGMAAGTARRRAAHSVIEGRLTPFQA